MKASKTAIATALGCDVSDIERYQATRCRGVYTDGNLYYCCVRPGAMLPDGFLWKHVAGTDWFTQLHGLEIYQSKQN